MSIALYARAGSTAEFHAANRVAPVMNGMVTVRSDVAGILHLDGGPDRLPAMTTRATSWAGRLCAPRPLEGDAFRHRRSDDRLHGME